MLRHGSGAAWLQADLVAVSDSLNDQCHGVYRPAACNCFKPAYYAKRPRAANASCRRLTMSTISYPPVAREKRERKGRVFTAGWKAARETLFIPIPLQTCVSPHVLFCENMLVVTKDAQR